MNTHSSKDIYNHDDIEEFGHRLREYVDSLARGPVDEHFIHLVKKLLHTNPGLFKDRRQ